MPTALGRLPSLFPRAIGNVVSVRSEKQMVRPNTRRVGAMMENMKAGRDRSVREQPRNAMRISNFMPEKADASVAIGFSRGSLPLPTACRNPNLGPEAMSKRDDFPASSALAFLPDIAVAGGGHHAAPRSPPAGRGAPVGAAWPRRGRRALAGGSGWAEGPSPGSPDALAWRTSSHFVSASSTDAQVTS